MLTVSRTKVNANSRFDQRLTIRGCGVVASMMIVGLMATSALAQTPVVNENQKILASDRAFGDRFGITVALSGDVMVVGSDRDDDLGSNSGSAYVFRRNGASWVQEQKLLASDGAAGDAFGTSVAVSGDVIVVGAMFDDDLGGSSGSADVYRWTDASWVHEQKLLPSDGVTGDRFGISVAIQSDVIVVGAESVFDLTTLSGAAYIFRWDGSSWVQDQKLLASDGADVQRFGDHVAINGDVIAVRSNYSLGTDAGRAYTFRSDGTSWLQEPRLHTADGAGSKRYGRTVGISGDVIVIGALFDADLGTNAGAAYVFRWNGVSWVQEQKLLASDGAAADLFGRSVAISGDAIVVGATNHDDTGSAYIFRWNGTSWIEEKKLLASDGRFNN